MAVVSTAPANGDSGEGGPEALAAAAVAVTVAISTAGGTEGPNEVCLGGGASGASVAPAAAASIPAVTKRAAGVCSPVAAAEKEANAPEPLAGRLAAGGDVWRAEEEAEGAVVQGAVVSAASVLGSVGCFSMCLLEVSVMVVRPATGWRATVAAVATVDAAAAGVASLAAAVVSPAVTAAVAVTDADAGSR